MIATVQPSRGRTTTRNAVIVAVALVVTTACGAFWSTWAANAEHTATTPADTLGATVRRGQSTAQIASTAAATATYRAVIGNRPHKSSFSSRWLALGSVMLALGVANRRRSFALVTRRLATSPARALRLRGPPALCL